MSLKFDLRTEEGRGGLRTYLHTLTTIHQKLVDRLLTSDVDPQLLSETFEDIGNRYLDLSEIVPAVTAVRGGENQTT